MILSKLIHPSPFLLSLSLPIVVGSDMQPGLLPQHGPICLLSWPDSWCMGIWFPRRHVWEKKDPVLQSVELCNTGTRLRTSNWIPHVCCVQISIWSDESGNSRGGVQSAAGGGGSREEEFGLHSDSGVLLCWDCWPGTAGLPLPKLEGSQCVYLCHWTGVLGTVEVNMCLMHNISLFQYYVSYCRLTPESPRWLLVQGREDEAKAVLAKIARGNGRKMTVSRLKRPTSQPSQTSVSVTELFRTPVIRQRTLILLVAWQV